MEKFAIYIFDLRGGKKRIVDLEQDREIKKKKDIYLLFNAIPKALNRIFEQDF